jgi:hypothetical protein
MLFYMWNKMPGCIVRCEHAKGSDSASARNHAIAKYSPDEVDFLLFIDSDMGFPPYALETLLCRRKKVISAVSFKKHGDFSPTIYERNGVNQMVSIDEFPMDKLFEAEGTGAAFLLVRMDVITAISKKHEEKVFEWGRNISEDLMFCERVREQGEKIWIDSSVLTDHFTMAPRGLEDFTRKKEGKRQGSGEVHKDGKGKTFDPGQFRKDMILPKYPPETFREESQPSFDSLKVVTLE